MTDSVKTAAAPFQGYQPDPVEEAYWSSPAGMRASAHSLRLEAEEDLRRANELERTAAELERAAMAAAPKPIDLKRCPFCGRHDLTIRDVCSEEDGRSYARAVFCLSCHATGGHAFRIGWAETDDGAAEGWNNRADEGAISVPAQAGESP